MIDILRVALAVYALGGSLALLAVVVLSTVAALRAKRRHEKLLSFLRRAEDGTLYVQDPETGTLHRLDDQLVKSVVGERAELSPRQHRKVRRQVRHALGAR